MYRVTLLLGELIEKRRTMPTSATTLVTMTAAAMLRNLYTPARQHLVHRVADLSP